MNIFHKVTRKTLAKNRTRTIVTIVGIMLSTALITAVTTFTSSMQNCLLQNAIKNDGDWYGAVHSVDENQVNELKNNKEITQIALSQNIGYSILENCINENKPFLNIIGIDTTFENTMPIKITSGRMPENASEMIIPNHLQENGGVKYNLNDTLNLEIGQRVLNGKVLSQDDGYLTKKEVNEKEQFEVKETRSYKIVGFYERPFFEPYSAPGYTAITIMDKTLSSSYLYNTYFKTDHAEDTKQLLDQYLSKKITPEYNNGVLRFLGVTKYSSFNQTILSILSITIMVIMCGSVLLIYNSFAISVSERTRQFGLLSSVGATKKQIIGSVFYEAVFVSLIGIPLGILVGIAGIGITLFCIKDKMMLMISGMFDTVIPLTLNVSWMAIIIAVITAMLTVLISAWIPSRRAMRVTALEAIQQSVDIKIKTKKVKTHKWIYKIFGLEGALAQKNFKRNRKKYRATIISLFMSIVLFITASSLCMYIVETSSGSLATNKYQISYTYTQSQNDNTGLTLQQLTKKFTQIEGVKNANAVYGANGTLMVSQDLLSDRYINDHKDINGNIVGRVQVYAIDDQSYENYLNEQHLSKEKYMNPAEPVLIASSTIRSKDADTGKLYNYKAFKADQVKITAKMIMYGHNSSGNSSDNNQMELNIGLFTDQMVMGINTNSDNSVIVMMPQCMIDTVYNRNLFDPTAYIHISTDAHERVFEKSTEMLKENSLPQNNLYDSVKDYEYGQNLIFIIQVFAYGFITMISLIAMANVFNTISTNILLRRREFAMLKSVGMTKRGFNKMMNFECLLYGIRSLLLGLPVSVLITYFIYKSVSNSYEMPFLLPWKAIAIAVCSVFTVVFITMMYAMGKIKKDNPIDALKNENL